MEKLTCSIGEKEHLSYDEACAFMEISLNTLIKWFGLGLKRSKIGQKTYVSKTRLREFLEKYEQ